jgi:uncharacterized repeat protein (TIGR01451 family)
MSRTIVRARSRGSVFALVLFTLGLLATAAAHGQVPLNIGITPGTDANGEPTYKATVINASQNQTAFNVTVTFTLPSGELPISPSPSGGCLFTPGPVHLTAVCSTPTLLAGQSHDFTIAVHPINTAPQDVTATAKEAAGGTASAFVTSTITEVGLTEMQVDMTSTNPGKVGELLTYNVTVTNIQDDDARNVFSVLVLPKGSTWVSATKGCTKGVVVYCKLGQMSPGTSKTVTINALSTISGWGQATAGVRLTTPDGVFTNNAVGNSIWINP